MPLDSNDQEHDLCHAFREREREHSLSNPKRIKYCILSHILHITEIDVCIMF
jgi:hypothetical protein